MKRLDIKIIWFICLIVYTTFPASVFYLEYIGRSKGNTFLFSVVSLDLNNHRLKRYGEIELSTLHNEIISWGDNVLIASHDLMYFYDLSLKQVLKTSPLPKAGKNDVIIKDSAQYLKLEFPEYSIPINVNDLEVRYDSLKINWFVSIANKYVISISGDGDSRKEIIEVDLENKTYQKIDKSRYRFNSFEPQFSLDCRQYTEYKFNPLNEEFDCFIVNTATKKRDFVLPAVNEVIWYKNDLIVYKDNRLYLVKLSNIKTQKSRFNAFFSQSYDLSDELKDGRYIRKLRDFELKNDTILYSSGSVQYLYRGNDLGRIFIENDKLVKKKKLIRFPGLAKGSYYNNLNWTIHRGR